MLFFPLRSCLGSSVRGEIFHFPRWVATFLVAIWTQLVTLQRFEVLQASFFLSFLWHLFWLPGQMIRAKVLKNPPIPGHWSRQCGFTAAVWRTSQVLKSFSNPNPLYFILYSLFYSIHLYSILISLDLYITIYIISLFHSILFFSVLFHSILFFFEA